MFRAGWDNGAHVAGNSGSSVGVETWWANSGQAMVPQRVEVSRTCRGQLVGSKELTKTVSKRGDRWGWTP